MGPSFPPPPSLPSWEPFNLKKAVSVGIGLFIAFIGLQNAKIVIGGSTLVGLFSLKGYNETLAEGLTASMSDAGITVLLAIIGVIITAVLVVKNIKGNILCRTLRTQPGPGLLQPASGFLQRDLHPQPGSDLL